MNRDRREARVRGPYDPPALRLEPRRVSLWRRVARVLQAIDRALWGDSVEAEAAQCVITLIVIVTLAGVIIHAGLFPRP